MSHHEEKQQNRQNMADKNKVANKAQGQAGKTMEGSEQNLRNRSREENSQAQTKAAETQNRSER